MVQLKSSDYKKMSAHVQANAKRYQAMWDEFQGSEY